MTLGLAQAEAKNGEPFRETTKPLLRPDQVQEFGEEHQRLDYMLKGPAHVQNQVQDRKTMIQQYQRLDKMLSEYAPRAYQVRERDPAVQRERELRDLIVADGMPTQEEMRRNPPGAVDKHMSWERRNKNRILEWKNIRRRLHATECDGGQVEMARDVANIETFRPAGLTRSMDMAGAQIPGKEFHFPPAGAGPVVMLDDAEMALLRKHRPDLAEQVALMDNDGRAIVKQIVALIPKLGAAPKVKASSKAKRKPMSPEMRDKFAQRMRDLHARKRAEKAQAA